MSSQDDAWGVWLWLQQQWCFAHPRPQGSQHWPEHPDQKIHAPGLDDGCL